MKIPLTQGKFAIVGPRDYKYLMQWKWFFHSEGYIIRRKGKYPNQKIFYMHRVILERMGFKNFTKSDHINRNILDNHRCNLRPATTSQNGCNRGANCNNKSGYKGVFWDRKRKKWVARIKIMYKSKFLGRLILKKKQRELIIKPPLNITVNLQF